MVTQSHARRLGIGQRKPAPRDVWGVMRRLRAGSPAAVRISRPRPGPLTAEQEPWRQHERGNQKKQRRMNHHKRQERNNQEHQNREQQNGEQPNEPKYNALNAPKNAASLTRCQRPAARLTHRSCNEVSDCGAGGGARAPSLAAPPGLR
jgi:hypothetical protein